MSNGDLRRSWFNGKANSDGGQVAAAPSGVIGFFTLSYTAILSDPVTFNELLVLLLDFSSIYSIWIIEGFRRGNSLTFPQL